MAENGKDFVMKNLTYKNLVEIYGEVYKKVIK